MKKNILYLLFVISIIALATSCEEMFGDYLEKAPGADVTEDTIFSSTAQLELFLAACYEQALYDPLEETKYVYGASSEANDIEENLSFFTSICDEGEHEAPWWLGQKINVGTLTSAGAWYDTFFKYRFAGIRMVNTMIERVDEVPDATEAYKKQIKAEAHHLRAELHFIFFKKYGGTSLVDKRFGPNEVEEMKIPRSSVDSTVQFIVKDLDYAIANLPNVYPSNMRGRITKGAALALKSKVLLYAASPLFNTDSPPLDMPNLADNRLICYGNYDKNRWQKAADAAKAVIDWAPSGGIHLITDQGVDKNYRYVWEQSDNAEIILSHKHANQTTRGQVKRPIRYWLAKAVGGQKGIQPTQNFIELYEKKDGTVMEWPDADDNLSERYAQLDYRFHQTIGYNGFYWNQKRGNLGTYLGPGQKGAQATPNITGYFAKKWIPDAVNRHQDMYDFDLPRYRLAEVYLNYAEALNEAQGPVAAAYDAVNTIRARSGMPPFPSGLSQEEFREKLRRERAVELAFEDHRYWDLRRWVIAEEVMTKPFYGIKVYKNQPFTDPLTFRYQKYVFENRVFKPEFYHDFYPVSELNLGYLVQNPGW